MASNGWTRGGSKFGWVLDVVTLSACVVLFRLSGDGFGPSWMRDVKFDQGEISGYRKVPRVALSSSHVKVGFGVVLRSRRPHTLGVGYWGWGGFEMMTVL